MLKRPTQWKDLDELFPPVGNAILPQNPHKPHEQTAFHLRSPSEILFFPPTVNMDSNTVTPWWTLLPPPHHHHKINFLVKIIINIKSEGRNRDWKPGKVSSGPRTEFCAPDLTGMKTKNSPPEEPMLPAESGGSWQFSLWGDGHRLIP